MNSAGSSKNYNYEPHPPPTPQTFRKAHMRLAWSDEGIGSANTPPNSWSWEQRITDKWQDPTELQTYTDNIANAHYDGDGHLAITAIKEGTAYSSAKLRSPQLWMYGLFEARIKVPTELGVWPAWWLLGEDDPYGWPYCGEIDIMEAPSGPTTYNQIHQGTHSAGPVGNDFALGVPPSHGNWSDYHTYSINWKPESIKFFIDHKPTGEITRKVHEFEGGTWVFDHRPLSPILNLAVGGWAGTPGVWDSQTMLIDYVRIYQ